MSEEPKDAMEKAGKSLDDTAEILSGLTDEISKLPFAHRVDIFRDEIISMLSEADENPRYNAVGDFELLLKEFDAWFKRESEK